MPHGQWSRPSLNATDPSWVIMPAAPPDTSLAWVARDAGGAVTPAGGCSTGEAPEPPSTATFVDPRTRESLLPQQCPGVAAIASRLACLSSALCLGVMRRLSGARAGCAPGR